MERALARRSLLRLISLTALTAAYTLVASLVSRPALVPPTRALAGAFGALVSRGDQPPAPAEPAERAPPAPNGEHRHHHHSSDQVETLVHRGVSLQASLAVTTARVLFGLAAGLPLGILLGLWMGSSRRADDYL